MSFLRLQCQDFLKERRVKKIHLFIYLFIINFAKRPGSLTEEAPLRGPEKKKKEKKISNTTSKNEKYFRNDKKN